MRINERQKEKERKTERRRMIEIKKQTDTINFIVA